MIFAQPHPFRMCRYIANLIFKFSPHISKFVGAPTKGFAMISFISFLFIPTGVFKLRRRSDVLSRLVLHDRHISTPRKLIAFFSNNQDTFDLSTHFLREFKKSSSSFKGPRKNLFWLFYLNIVYFTDVRRERVLHLGETDVRLRSPRSVPWRIRISSPVFLRPGSHSWGELLIDFLADFQLDACVIEWA